MVEVCYKKADRSQHYKTKSMNAYLETAIALVFILFTFSTVTYVIQESIALKLQFRNRMLKDAIEQILNKKGSIFHQQFLNHPQFKTLTRSGKQFPAYIPSANFAIALIDAVANLAPRTAGAVNLLADFRAGLQTIAVPNPDLFTLLKNASDHSNTLKELEEGIEKWFNSYMERVSGWYKNKYTWITRLIAICVALAFNLDMVNTAKLIYGDPLLRASLNAVAERKVLNPGVTAQYLKTQFDTDTAAINAALNPKIDGTANAVEKDKLKKDKEDQLYKLAVKLDGKLDSIRTAAPKDVVSDQLPFSWTTGPFTVIDPVTHQQRDKSFSEVVIMLLGLVIGAGAISMGSPFWFDLMLKLVNVRRAGQKPKN